PPAVRAPSGPGRGPPVRRAAERPGALSLRRHRYGTAAPPGPGPGAAPTGPEQPGSARISPDSDRAQTGASTASADSTWSRTMNARPALPAAGPRTLRSMRRLRVASAVERL